MKCLLSKSAFRKYVSCVVMETLIEHYHINARQYCRGNTSNIIGMRIECCHGNAQRSFSWKHILCFVVKTYMKFCHGNERRALL